LVDSVVHKEWFDMARKDLRGAEILLEHGADMGLVCFHCQQAIEKYLKGFLIKASGALQQGHNLVKLCKKAAVYHRDLDKFTKDLAFVNTFYIETRYPAEDPLILSDEDAEECLRITKEVIKKIESIMNK
jgi:HEPN domain-containing protein